MWWQTKCTTPGCGKTAASYKAKFCTACCNKKRRHNCGGPGWRRHKCVVPGCKRVAASHRAKFCKKCHGIHARHGCRVEKKDSVVLLQDFRLFAQWAVSKLEVLRSRRGSGFKEKLRTQCGVEERSIYDWLRKFANDLEPGSMLEQQLAIVDAFVTKSEAALLQEYQVHAAPSHAASAADGAVEAGTPAQAC